MGLYGNLAEFVSLRPKMYSLLYRENNKMIQEKVTKGIAKHVTKQKIKHEHYKQCLFHQEQQMATRKQLRFPSNSARWLESL